MRCSAAVVTLVVLVLAGAGLAAAGEQPCRKKALAMLKAGDRDGYAVYEKVGEDPFALWLSCGVPGYAVSLAVHESVHMLGARKSTAREHHFYLPGGEMVSVARRNLFPRSEIAQYLKAPDRGFYHQTYLTGASGGQDLTLLLDELNAYTHSCYTETRLYKHLPGNVRTSTRDALGTFMYYVELYLKHARTVRTDDYERLRSDATTLAVIRRMWENAEDALSKSAGCRNLGTYDRYVLKQVFDDANLAEIRRLFEGRQGPAFRADIVTKLRLKAALTRREIPRPARVTVKRATATAGVVINGKRYTCAELKETAPKDPSLKLAYEALRSANLCP